MSRNRRGSNLIEMIVVITLSSTVMIIAVGWIHQSMKLGSIIRERQRHHQSLMRLSRQLRDDVRSGESMSMSSGTELVIRQDESKTCSYAIGPNGILFQARRKDEVIQQDFFRTSPSVNIVWETSEMPDWISLVVFRADGRLDDAAAKTTPFDAGPVPDLHVRVPVDRDKRMNAGGAL